MHIARATIETSVRSVIEMCNDRANCHVIVIGWVVSCHVVVIGWLVSGHVTVIGWLVSGHVIVIGWLVSGHVIDIGWLVSGHVTCSLPTSEQDPCGEFPRDAVSRRH